MNDNIIITEVNVQNVKGVKSISISPKMSTIVGGDNGQGKSSFIDAILLTIKNREMGNIVEKIINEDADTAETEITLSNGLTIESQWKKDASGKVTRELRVVDKDGKSISRPQEYLDSITNGFGFDPTKFFSLSKEEQYRTIIGLTDLDISSLNMKQETLKLNRRDVNREIKRLEGVICEYDFSAPIEKQDTSALAEELKKAQEHNLELDNFEVGINSIKNQMKAENLTIFNAENQIQMLMSQIKGLENVIENSKRKITSLNTELEAKLSSNSKMERINTDLIVAKINSISEHNQKVIEHEKMQEIRKRILALNEEADNIERDIQEITKIKINAINSLGLVQGLSVDEEKKIVVINGIPLKDLSSSEQMQLAVKLAMKTNPKVKVLFLQNASLLDKKSLNEIINICNIEGWQVFFEVVGIGNIIIKEGVVLDDVERDKYTREYYL